MHKAENERRRLHTLRVLERHNPDMEQLVRNFVLLAADIIEVDYAAIHFITDKHQEVKAKVGMQFPRMDKSESICRFTVEQREQLSIPNLTEDERTADIWYVKDEPGFRAYASVPLIAKNGTCPGTFNVMHKKIRDFSEREMFLLTLLASEVIEKLERNTLQKYFKNQAENRKWMIKEIHHRLKNHLSIISGLMDIESMQAEHEETRQIMDSMKKRLQSISDVHNKLYESDSLEDLNILEYTTDLVNSISESYNQFEPEIECVVEGDQFMLGERKAVTLGLLVNELVTNAFKHAFEEGDHGKIWVGLHQDDRHHFTLEVEDNGKGLPEDFDPESNESLGFKLIHTLVEQIDGEYDIDSEPGEGTHFTIRFHDGE